MIFSSGPSILHDQRQILSPADLSESRGGRVAWAVPARRDALVLRLPSEIRTFPGNQNTHVPPSFGGNEMKVETDSPIVFTHWSV